MSGSFDRFAAARSVADAVLYEGYVLYPYRASSRKNQVRWQFGVLTPKAFSESDGSERWSMHTECLVHPGAAPVLSVRIRCLQVQHRIVEALVSGSGDDAVFAPVDHLEVDGTNYVEWEEAVDQILDVTPLALLPIEEATIDQGFSFEGGTDMELLYANDGTLVGRLVRRREPVDGHVGIVGEVAPHADDLIKLTITVGNVTDWFGSNTRRDELMVHSLVAVHTMLAVDDGTFISLLDPPESAVAAVSACRSEGAFPVLIGENDVMLSSPIILYDHPEVAPESPGDLYDSTEIDEILALRVMTLTDEEKSEARGTDARSAAIIDRCDDMGPEIWERLHGAMKEVRPSGFSTPTFSTPIFGDEAVPTFVGDVEGEPEPLQWWDPDVDAAVDPWTDTVLIAGVEVTKGSAVILRPSARSDAQDMFLHGVRATVAGVFKDVDGDTHVAVSVNDDPATDELIWQGRYLFFHPEEVEPLVDEGAER